MGERNNIEEIREKNKQQNTIYKKDDDYLYQYKAEDILEPVADLMLYWGKRKWKKPLCLKDMVGLSSASPAFLSFLVAAVVKCLSTCM